MKKNIVLLIIFILGLSVFGFLLSINVPYVVNYGRTLSSYMTFELAIFHTIVYSVIFLAFLILSIIYLVKIIKYKKQ